MFKWLLLLPIFAFGDPWLLYLLWNPLGFYGQIIVLFIYPIVATVIARSRETAAEDPLNLTLGPVRKLTRVLIWWPGVLCKIVSALMLVPAIERGLAGLILQRIQKHFLGGLNIPGMPLGGGPPPAGGMKPTRGKVIK